MSGCGKKNISARRWTNSTPLLKDLQNDFTPHFAASWRVIGTQLSLTSEELNIIEYDNHHRAVRCCNAVLEKWLEQDKSASWEKLLIVIESPALYSDQRGDQGMVRFIISI